MKFIPSWQASADLCLNESEPRLSPAIALSKTYLHAKCPFVFACYPDLRMGTDAVKRQLHYSLWQFADVL